MTAYEIDDVLASYLQVNLTSYGNGAFRAFVVRRDFIEDAVNQIQFTPDTTFTHAILNPPYKKISSGSRHRHLLRALGLETVNLYTAFLGVSIELMAKGGEIVAIIPRSFCNGLYYKPFREWCLNRCSIEHIHLFHSRTSAFHEDEVLQENVILKLIRGGEQGHVTVSTSSDTGFSDLKSHRYAFADIVAPDDSEMFIHIPVSPSNGTVECMQIARHTLTDVGLEVSTGPVVDFRLEKFLRSEPEGGTIPLLYATHFTGGKLQWPRVSKKPNAILDDPEVKKWLFPNGYYTVVRRFSSKEERRRIVAHVVTPDAFDSKLLGFENHLNVFHSKRHGIEPSIAHGLCTFLNSTAVDECFRRFSGHTQVNATDLRRLRYPPKNKLAELGAWAKEHQQATQDAIDRQLEKLNG